MLKDLPGLMLYFTSYNIYQGAQKMLISFNAGHNNGISEYPRRMRLDLL